MKKIALISVLAVACIALTVFGTYAVTLITSESTAENVITMGDLSIAAVQTAIPEGEIEPKAFSGDIHVIPGKQNSLIFAVKNTGSQDAYVRVSVKKTIKLASGVLGNPDTALMQFNINETDWELKDGYYYYKKPLNAGETSAPLYTGVTFDKNMSNMYQEATAKADNFVSATQVKNNGTDVFSANGWVNEN